MTLGKFPYFTQPAMSTFLTENFLLQSDAAVRLYHDYAVSMPIIDYHCHLSPKDIAEDRRFSNITQIWLAGDHYKWRAMRAAGVDEQFITGDATDWEKFEKWAETAPKTLRNPLYHWTHLELRRPFGIIVEA
jgi:glucuronate isomerase